MISSNFDHRVLLITGGTGSFGNAVLRRFLSSGLYEIRILRARYEISRTKSCIMRVNPVVPLTVKFIACNPYGLELLIADFNA